MIFETTKTRWSILAAALLSLLLASSFMSAGTAYATELRGGFGPSSRASSHYDIAKVKTDLSPLNRSPKLIVELDKLIDSVDAKAPKMFRVELELFKLDVLAKIADPSVAAKQAEKIYADHPRGSFSSDVEYGDTMYQIVESLAKTDNLGISYNIIQKLRLSLYENPNSYLAFIVDKSLIEVYIETSDFQRALNLALSVIENPEFMTIAQAKKWRLIAVNEIAYLYNQLGDGENALIYLQESANALKTQKLSHKKLRKAQALNFANRGRAYLDLKDYTQARQMGEQVREVNKDLKQSYLAAVSHRLIGGADVYTGHYLRASQHLKAGIGLAQEDNNLSLKLSLYSEYAVVLGHLGHHEASAHWYKKLYMLETERQNTISATRAKLNDAEFSAYKDHQAMMHLHHDLTYSQSMNKMMLFAILSLLGAGGILMWLLQNLRKHQKKLEKSEMKAQVANQAKSDFLANMSHEIRTPLNGVLGMAQVLERTPLSEQQKVYLKIIKQSGGTLLDLINDILDFSKIEADKLILKYENCNLDQTVQDIVHLLRPNAQEKQISINYNYDPNIPKFFALDGKRTRQIVMNLIGNAIKFTSEGRVTVNIGADIQNDTARIIISVSDTGMGIKSDQLGSVFEKFTQVGKGSERFYGGTGLGLAISHKLTKAMDGDLTVKSTLGEGSEFTLSLPAQVVTAPANVKTLEGVEVVSPQSRAAA